MDEPEKEFTRLVGAVLVRFFAQNAASAPDEEKIAGAAARLWELVVERGLSRPLAGAERGAPGEMTDAECAPLVARVLGGAEDPLLANAAKQLVKACFYPEFKTCRDSWCEVTAEGQCRRQDLARVRGRVSGSHCVDCPHWVALTPIQHEKFLAREWRANPAGSTGSVRPDSPQARQAHSTDSEWAHSTGSGQAGSGGAGAAEFEAHRGIFLPEDFRALRQWLWARARAPLSSIN